jgi:hypothetical protein
MQDGNFECSIHHFSCPEKYASSILDSLLVRAPQSTPPSCWLHYRHVRSASRNSGSVSFIQLHSKSYLLEAPQLHAMTAVSAFFVLLIFALLVKRIRYEVFYISHILMYMVIIINVGFHRPLLSTRSVIITGFAGGQWGPDRLLRAGGILWYAYDNSAKITPLSHGGTRVVLQRSSSRAVAGTHCFLWIPKIRAFETHPSPSSGLQRSPWTWWLQLTTALQTTFTATP